MCMHALVSCASKQASKQARTAKQGQTRHTKKEEQENIGNGKRREVRRVREKKEVVVFTNKRKMDISLNCKKQKKHVHLAR